MTGIWTSFAIIIIPATKARYFGEIVQCATTSQKLLVRTTMLQEHMNYLMLFTRKEHTL